MRVQQHKKRNTTLPERNLEPNDKLGDVKPNLSDVIGDSSITTKLAREANRKQAKHDMKLRPTIQKMPKQGMATQRARHNIDQPRQGF